MNDYVCVRCRGALQVDANHLSCVACGEAYPIISTIPVLVQRPDALLIDLHRTIEAAGTQFERARQRLLDSTNPGVSPGFRARAERWCHGVESNLRLIHEHVQGIGAYVSALGSRELSLLDWVSLQHGGWLPRATLPYFYQDWGGTAEFNRVRQLIGTALETHAPDRRRAVVLGAGACGIARVAATAFARVSAVDLSVPTLLLARALLAGAPLEIQLEKAEWRTVRLSAPAADPERLTLATADAAALPFADGTQSAVVTQYLMDLVGNPLHVVDEIQRVLVPGGIWINFSIPFLLPGEAVEAGTPALAELSEMLQARGWNVVHHARERFALTSLDAIYDGGERTSHEVHFLIARKLPGQISSPQWFDAADWHQWRVRTVAGRQPEFSRANGAAGRVTIRVGRMTVDVDAVPAGALEALFGLIDGQRTLGEITTALATKNVSLTELEWRELFHYLSDRYGIVEAQR
jgi:SAM-dependent methyltransferase